MTIHEGLKDEARRRNKKSRTGGGPAGSSGVFHSGVWGLWNL